MKQGWVEKKLGEILVKTETVDPTKKPNEEFIYLDVSSVNKETKEIENATVLLGKDAPSRARKLVRTNDVIFATVRPTHSRVALITEEYDEQVCSTGYFVLRGKDFIFNQYLFYFLLTEEFNEQMGKLQKGASYPAVTDAEVKSILLRYPKSLAEQQRIVAILDEAFAAIAKAKANAEQNLKNAKALFESYLQGVFEKKREGWEQTSLKNEIDLLVGFAFKSKEYTEIEDDILLLRGDNIMQGSLRWEDVKRWRKSEYDDYKKYQLQQNDIVLAMDRPWVKAGLKIARLSKNDLPSLLVQRTACLRTKSKLDNSFLFHLLKSNGFMNYLIDVQTGIGVPHISGQQILDFTFNRPSIKEQQTIVKKLDALSTETKKLEAIYQQKINNLEELKKSVLQKAFAGELAVADKVAKIIPMPVKVDGITSTDLQAGIVALAMQRHDEMNSSNTLHHVKTEKIVHLVEYIVEIDLERNPFKDAAGPNDFPHAKKVESRAAKAGFYTVRKKDDFYTYTAGPQFNKLIAKIKLVLQEKEQALIQLIDLIVPMKTQQAEIFATVYAAWNNLLIDNVAITDEAIVYEARENWHGDKLNIPREKFFGAIEWMKKKNIIPKGSGKKVLPKNKK